MIPDGEIDRIKRETDLAAVVRTRGVELKAQGGDLVGLCPFHEDHDPSLRVTPGKGLWRCMSCHATGNVIQFVQRFDGVSFRHAFELLQNGAAFTGIQSGHPTKKSTVPRLPAPVAADADDQAALRQVLDYYHERLPANTPALEYLKKRGITDEAMAAFGLGFVDRTLGLRLPQKNRQEGAMIRERLTRLGIFRDTGHEHLRGRITFPVIAEDGGIGTVYGRSIDNKGKHDRHLFLPGPQRGIWNPAALKSPEVILTEGVIDALTFWCAGFQNVTTGYSAKALPQELLDALLATKTQRVFIAFDRDDSGEKGATEVSGQLAAHGIECRRVLFPHGHDANSYALAVKPAEKSLGILLRGADFLSKGQVVDAPSRAPSSLAAKAAKPFVEKATKEKTDVLATTARNNGSGTLPLNERGAHHFLEHDGREWRVGGLAKATSVEVLKVTLRVRVGELMHVDQVDLCRDADRRRFAERAAEELALQAELIRRDLGRLLLASEQVVEARQSAEAQTSAQGAANLPELTPVEREDALELLQDSDLWERLAQDAATCGIAGEKVNLRVGYLGAVSRLLDRPLAIIVQSSSAAGKTTLMDAILAFVPPSQRIKYSAMTGQSLFYLGGADLRHKILAIVEEEGAEKASYALKLLQSEGELTIASTGKDPHTGRMETQEYHVEGPVMIMLTTTSADIDEELQNRCLVLTVDESREQTERIHALQREARTEAGLARKVKRDALLAVHRAAQSLLESLPVFNPFASKLRFLSHRLRTRRDHEKYLILIDALALLFQHQRERQEIAGREHIVATLDDIARANELAHEILGRGLDDMPPQTRRLLGLIQDLEKKRDTKTSAPGGWRRRDLRAFSGWGDTQLKVHLARLVELEYVLGSRDPDHRQGYLYELMFDGDPVATKPHLSGLLDVETLRKQVYEANRSGQIPERSGSGRPVVGPQSGDGRGGQKGSKRTVTNDLSKSDKKRTENARPEVAALVAVS